MKKSRLALYFYSLYTAFSSIYVAIINNIIYDKLDGSAFRFPLSFVPVIGLIILYIVYYQFKKVESHYENKDLVLQFSNIRTDIWSRTKKNAWLIIASFILLFIYPFLIKPIISNGDYNKPLIIENTLKANYVNSSTIITFQNRKLPHPNQTLLFRGNKQPLDKSVLTPVFESPIMTDTSLVWDIRMNSGIQRETYYYLLEMNEKSKTFHRSNFITEDSKPPSLISFNKIQYIDSTLLISWSLPYIEEESFVEIIIQETKHNLWDTIITFPKKTNSFTEIPKLGQGHFKILAKCYDKYDNYSQLDTVINIRK